MTLIEAHKKFCKQEDYEDFEEFLKMETDLLKGICIGIACHNRPLKNGEFCKHHYPKRLRVYSFSEIALGIGI